jgi:dihydrofolate reductase
MKVTVFVGVSVDGFIARPDGTFGFLPEDPEPHGFEELMASVDTLVMGRKTFETVMGFDGWPYEKKPVLVLSSRPVDLQTARARGGVVDAMGGEPAEIIEALTARGAHHIYLDGGLTIQRFLRAGLVSRLVVTRVPVLIGQGISLFGNLHGDIPLRHVATRSYPSGLVQSEYEVIK